MVSIIIVQVPALLINALFPIVDHMKNCASQMCFTVIIALPMRLDVSKPVHRNGTVLPTHQFSVKITAKLIATPIQRSNVLMDII